MRCRNGSASHLLTSLAGKHHITGTSKPPAHRSIRPSYCRTHHRTLLCQACNILRRFDWVTDITKGISNTQFLLKPSIQPRSMEYEQPDVIDADFTLTDCPFQELPLHRKRGQGLFLHPLTHETSAFHKERKPHKQSSVLFKFFGRTIISKQTTQPKQLPCTGNHSEGCPHTA